MHVLQKERERKKKEENYRKKENKRERLFTLVSVTGSSVFILRFTKDNFCSYLSLVIRDLFPLYTAPKYCHIVLI